MRKYCFKDGEVLVHGFVMNQDSNSEGLGGLVTGEPSPFLQNKIVQVSMYIVQTSGCYYYKSEFGVFFG